MERDMDIVSLGANRKLYSAFNFAPSLNNTNMAAVWNY
jgi:hypothetical protein